MVRLTLALAPLLIGLFCASAVNAQTFELLKNDISRSQLARLAVQLTDPGSRGIGPTFNLPEDADRTYTYGIDIRITIFQPGKRSTGTGWPPKESPTFI